MMTSTRMTDEFIEVVTPRDTDPEQPHPRRCTTETVRLPPSTIKTITSALLRAGKQHKSWWWALDASRCLYPQAAQTTIWRTGQRWRCPQWPHAPASGSQVSPAVRKSSKAARGFCKHTRTLPIYCGASMTHSCTRTLCH